MLPCGMPRRKPKRGVTLRCRCEKRLDVLQTWDEALWERSFRADPPTAILLVESPESTPVGTLAHGTRNRAAVRFPDDMRLSKILREGLFPTVPPFATNFDYVCTQCGQPFAWTAARMKTAFQAAVAVGGRDIVAGFDLPA